MDKPLQQYRGRPFDLSREPTLVGNSEHTCILIADDHPIFRNGLRMLLETEPGFRVVGEAGDGKEAIELARQLKPDLLLLDLAMPHCSGLDVLHELARFSTLLRTIILAAAVEPSEMVQAIQLGARAVILKESATQTLFDCIRTVMAGRYWVGNENVSDLVQALRRLPPAATTGKERRTLGLTGRELEVVATVVDGHYTSKDIAQTLSISEHTVKTHLTNIFDKLGLSTRLELVLFAMERRLTDKS
jgi:two-component system, NarL family, nitrate/nitrite response regulator NarL